MRSYAAISVVPARNLEVGDLMAHEFLGTVVSGEITGIAYSKYDLTAEQIEYMKKNNLDIPVGEFEAIGGPSSSLFFGNFYGRPYTKGGPDHMFLDHNHNVAVFANSRKKDEPCSHESSSPSSASSSASRPGS